MTPKMSKRFRNTKLIDVTASEYEGLKDRGLLGEFFPQASGDYNADMVRETMREEMNPEGKTFWPYGAGESYAEKIERVYELEKDNMFVDTYIPKEERIAMELEAVADSLLNISKLLKGES